MPGRSESRCLARPPLIRGDLMLRSSRVWLAILLPAGLLAAPGGVSAADLAGNWKFKQVPGGNELTLALLHIEQKDGKPTAEVLGAPLINGQPAIEDLRADGQGVAFTFKVGPTALKVTLKAPPGVEKPERLKGVIEVNGQTIPAELEKTDTKEINRADATKVGPAGEALNKARRASDAKERVAALKELLEKYPDSSAAHAAAQMLLQERAREGASDEVMAAAAKEFLRHAAAYGSALEKEAQRTVTQAQVTALKALARSLRT